MTDATCSHVNRCFSGARRPTNSTSGSLAGSHDAADLRDGTMGTGTGIVASGTRGATLATAVRFDEETVLTAANRLSIVRVNHWCTALVRRRPIPARGEPAKRSEWICAITGMRCQRPSASASQPSSYGTWVVITLIGVLRCSACRIPGKASAPRADAGTGTTFTLSRRHPRPAVAEVNTMIVTMLPGARSDSSRA